MATIASSISHGGDREGTTSYFRTEKIVQPDGSVEHVPVGSGNALRGLLRDHSADMLWELLGRPELPPPIYHFLYSGGGLTKTGSGKTLGSRQLAHLRALVPHVSLFGGAGAGRIIEGKLSVGKLVPVVVETAHIVPAELRTGMERSIHDYAQIEQFSRRDDTHRAHSSAALTAKPAAAIGGTLTAVSVEPDPDRDGPATQMRYGVQTLPVGLRLWWWLSLRHVSDLELAWFGATLSAWGADGACFGGRAATGHGRLLLESTHGWVPTQPALTAGADLPATVSVSQHTSTHRQQILDALALVT